MNDSNNNHGPEMMIGGALLAIFLMMAVIKALKQFFTELGQAFEAFGHTVGSFTFMLWNILQVVFLVSLIIASVVCTVYFTIQYYKMVKDGIKLREWVNDSIGDMDRFVSIRADQLTVEVNRQVANLRRELQEALKEPEIAPPMPNEITDGTSTSPSTETSSMATNETHDSQPEESSGEDESKNEGTKTESVTMSNPY